MKLSTGRIISTRALYKPCRQSVVVGYASLLHARTQSRGFMDPRHDNRVPRYQGYRAHTVMVGYFVPNFLLN